MEEWTTCPYNATHKMPKSRFHWHIIKCPDKKRVGEHYAACPFNAQHIILKSEMTNHKMKCPDRDQREMISGQSDDIDRRIKEYLANQNHNKQNVQNTGEWGSSSWDAASNLPVGETLDITPSTKPKKKKSPNHPYQTTIISHPKPILSVALKPMESRFQRILQKARTLKANR
mmetsp:Transcript_19524/g.27242  ORF Transcript_19524/g.27242 Transcript_19524/m.27242 type:complete len:173 (-) Transcript_19524:928-1446(-)